MFRYLHSIIASSLGLSMEPATDPQFQLERERLQHERERLQHERERALRQDEMEQGHEATNAQLLLLEEKRLKMEQERELRLVHMEERGAH